jgi:glycosyltransferase involved in cell wall biosynthesis
MHVLVVPSWYPTTEAPLDGIYFAEQARCLNRNGFQVGVVYPEQQSLRRASWSALREKHFQTEWTHEDGLPTLRRYSWNVWWRSPPGLRCRVRSAVRLAHRYVERYGPPDLIHAQSGHWAGAAAARIGDAYSVPSVLTEHFSGFHRGTIFPWRWSIVEEGYRKASAVAAVSSSLKTALVERGLAPAARVTVHPNLAPTTQFPRPPDGRPSAPPVRFVTVARLSPQKNIGGLLRAFARIAADDSSVVLTVVGDGPTRTELETCAHRLGIDDRVTFQGELDREGVRDVLWDAHAFVLPSHYETFGVVLLEAMATGLPVVATACGGPDDLVTPDTGFLVPAHDTDALSDALRRMRNEAASFDPAAIRQYVLDHYGPEPFVRRTRLLYRRARSRFE